MRYITAFTAKGYHMGYKLCHRQEEYVLGIEATCRALNIAVNGAGRCLLRVKQNAKHRSDMFMNDAYQRLRLQLSLVAEPQPD